MVHKLGILTSLYDDDAPELLRTIDDAIEKGIIQAEVPAVFCDKKEGINPKIDERIRKVRELRHLGNLVFLSPNDVDTEFYRAAKAAGNESELMGKFRERYDRVALERLPKADSYLNIGWMRMMTPALHDTLNIVNLHPGLPNIGPIGMWPKVMEEQATRPLQYLLVLEERLMDSHIPSVMRISRNKAGGMLHLTSEEPDRGPVISWYEFPLDSPELNELWYQVANYAGQHGIEKVMEAPSFETLTKEIRREQLKGEHPLLVITYKNLTQGKWEIKDRTLYVDGVKCPEGYCLNKEIDEYLRFHEIDSLIE